MRTGTAVDMMRLWESCRTETPSPARPFSRRYWATRAAMPLIWGAAMEVPDMLV